MDSRRLTGLIALIVLLVVVGALVYLDVRGERQEPTTAFAPATSTDESVAAPDTPIEPPAAVAAAPTAEGPGAQVETAAPGQSAEAAPHPASEPATEVAMAPPTAEQPPPAAPAKPAVPSFDVVRVEPSGEAVIAGQAEANATIEVLDGPTVVATAQANDRGEWVIALDKALPPGAHDLAVRTTSPDKTVAILSDQRVTVSVPEGGSNDVLVVLNAPNAPSTVLQVPPETEGQAAASGVAQEEPPVTGDEVAAAQGTPSAGQPAASESGQEVAMMEPSAAPAAGQETAVPAGVSAAATPAPGEESAAVAKPSAEPAVATGAPLVAEAPVAAEPPIPAEAPVTAEPQVAATTAPAVAEPPPPEPKVVVAAVEADTGGALYIAGTATTDGTVRVYIDGAVIGDAVSSPSGTWLIETTRDMPAGSYVVRADQVDDGGNVVARSEVPFEREVEVAILKPTGMTASADGATLTGAVEMETVIIKRGDNLWRIARGAWGKGIRWSTIYQANADQIRNPHWIYPGQVFVMPKGDPAWQN